MESKMEQGTIIDHLWLMKLTGLYQLLNPDSPKLYGFNIYKIAFLLQMVLFVITIVNSINSISFSLHNFNEIVKYLIVIIGAFLGFFKNYFFIRNSNTLWHSLKLTSINFISCGTNKKDILLPTQKKFKSGATICLSLWIFFFLANILSPLLSMKNYFNVIIENKKYRYHYNVFNLIFPVTDDFYNKFYGIFYFYELLVMLNYTHSMLNFDVLVFSMCITVIHQYKVIADSYQTLISPSYNWLISKEESAVMTKFTTLIQDQQNVFKRMQTFYKIVRPFMFLQLAIFSVMIILQPSKYTMNYIKGYSLTSTINSKTLVSMSVYVIHLYFTCHLFNTINEQKESINFGLYSSDWTTMTIRLKKLLLFAMRMNDAQNFKLQISTNQIINMEMFASVIQIAYRVVSVIAKSYKR